MRYQIDRVYACTDGIPFRVEHYWRGQYTCTFLDTQQRFVATERELGVLVEGPSQPSKPQMSLLSFHALTEEAKVLTFGETKHPGQPWRKMTEKDHMDAALRHLAEYMQGNKTDSESGLSHLAHVRARLAFTMELLRSPVCQP